MLSTPSYQAVCELGRFLRDAGFDVAHLGDELGLSDGLYATRENLESLLARTDAESALAVLARLLFVTWPVSQSLCRAVLPGGFLDSALACGLLVVEEDNYASTAAIMPFRSLLIACDSSRMRDGIADVVTGPSASTNFPARFAIGGRNETTLDLGTGTGALALDAAAYSKSVIGTDVNPRALTYSAFNAALNDVRNVEWRCGDAFQPVAGQRFTRILANPPFFLTPAHVFTYSDSPLKLDGFTERLARECSSYLEEGGFYQMICEWVELEGQPWEQRLHEWVSGSNCDVFVAVGPRLTPVAYAEKRTNELRLMQSTPEHSFTRRYRYLMDNKVTQVVGGVINMRKRSGVSNWFHTAITDNVGIQIGADVRARFDTLTLLNNADDKQLLQMRFKLSPEVILTQLLHPGQDQWQLKSVDLVKSSGLTDRLRLDEIVSRFLPLFDGAKTLGEMAGIVRDHLQITAEDAIMRCLQLAKRLLQSNFINPA